MPTEFSYARVLDGIWSGGTYVCWGTDNREAPVRLCGLSTAGSPNRPHFEIKTVDGTSNPYLAFAALLGAGSLGVRQGALLTSGDCSRISAASMSEEERKDIGLEDTARIPESITDARAKLKEDSQLIELLGETFAEAYFSVNEVRNFPIWL